MSMIILETPRLVVRNWQDEDKDLFHHINSDEQVMEFFPFRRDRAESDAAFKVWQQMITNTGLGFYALEDKASGKAIGCAGLLRTDLEPYLPNGTVEIGWRLAQPYWGKGFVSEAATALLNHAFTRLNLSEIVAFAVEGNIRSTAVMQRIGMRHDPASDFMHPRVPDNAPHLKRHVVYRIQAPQAAPV